MGKGKNKEICMIYTLSLYISYILMGKKLIKYAQKKEKKRKERSYEDHGPS